MALVKGKDRKTQFFCTDENTHIEFLNLEFLKEQLKKVHVKVFKVL